MRIGGTGESPPLPADLHDYRYFVGGGRGAKRAADAEFWTELTERVLREMR